MELAPVTGDESPRGVLCRRAASIILDSLIRRQNSFCRLADSWKETLDLCTASPDVIR